MAKAKAQEEVAVEEVQEAPAKVAVANVEIKNPDALGKIPEVYESGEVPYPSEEARVLAEKLNKGKENLELNKVLRAIRREQQQNLNSLKVKGELKDITQQILFQIGFRLKHGYEEKPKYLMQGANVEPLDPNREFYIITWPS